MRLEPMTEADYVTYRATAEEGYAQHVAESGAMPLEEAIEKAAADYGRLLPEGLDTPEQHLLTAYAGNVAVGWLWLHVADGRGFVYDVEVLPEHRRAGHGRAIMLAAEDFCRERGVTSIGLTVWGQNKIARQLYESLGYQTTSVQMRKSL